MIDVRNERWKAPANMIVVLIVIISIHSSADSYLLHLGSSGSDSEKENGSVIVQLFSLLLDERREPITELRHC